MRPETPFFTVACVASVSVRFSARSRHFSFFSRAKIGASAKKCVTSPPQKKGKMPRTCGKPYGNACYAGYFHSLELFNTVLTHYLENKNKKQNKTKQN